MHWSCFHYEFEHGLGEDSAETGDPDIACRDPSCPAQAFDDQAPPDWNADLRPRD
jgi:hypothetical protein